MPPIVRRAKLMFDTWPTLHVTSGAFAVFLRDSIKREIISGMTLSEVALAEDADGLDTTRKTHINTPLRVRSRCVRFASSAIDRTVTYSTGACLIEAYVWLVVSGGTQIDKVITHGCKNLEEKEKKVASGEDQEIRGGVLADLLEKARDAATMGKISVTFRGIYDDKHGQAVFDEEGIRWRGMGGGKQKERTVRQRKHGVGHVPLSP